MRIGTYTCQIQPGSRSAACYGESIVQERHRNRYGLNQQYVESLVGAGMRVAGLSSEGLVEIIELEDHPWFVGTLFHPEFKSRPTRPHPLFAGYIGAILENRKG